MQIGKINLIQLNYPSILMLVSNRDTITSVSKLTSLVTSFTAFSNSSKSPNTYNINSLNVSAFNNFMPSLY